MTSNTPRQHLEHKYFTSVRFPDVWISPAELELLIRRLMHEWPGVSYDVISRNCHHFSGFFLAELSHFEVDENTHLELERLGPIVAAAMAGGWTPESWTLPPFVNNAATGLDKMRKSISGDGEDFDGGSAFFAALAETLVYAPSASTSNTSAEHREVVCCFLFFKRKVFPQLRKCSRN